MTDHGSLQWLLNFKHPDGQMARWLTFFGNYDLTIKYKPGKDNIADPLSRKRPCDADCKHCCRQELKEAKALEREKDYICCTVNYQQPETLAFNPWTDEQIKQWQLSDPVLKYVYQWIESRTRPKWTELEDKNRTLRLYYEKFNHLTLKDGVLYKTNNSSNRAKDKLRLVVPQCLKQEIFEFLHFDRTGGHLGITRTEKGARRKFFWTEMKADVRR